MVVCTKADLIDEGNDIIGSGPSGMGGMVKGKGGEWEERTDSIMQILRTICLKCRYSGLAPRILLFTFSKTAPGCSTRLHNPQHSKS